MENCNYYVFTVNNRRAALAPEIDGHWADLQALVDGYLQIEPLRLENPGLWIASNDEGFLENLPCNILLPAYRGDIIFGQGGPPQVRQPGMTCPGLHGFPGPVAFALVQACNTWIRDGKAPAIVEDICALLQNQYQNLSRPKV